jgi:LysM repeat protein
MSVIFLFDKSYFAHRIKPQQTHQILKEGIMKKLFFLLAIATLITSLAFTHVSTTPSKTKLLTEDCGATYKVQRGDSLAKIGMRCGLTIAKLISMNPQIKDPNLIYPGQILRLDPNVDWSITQVNPLFYTYSYFDWAMLYTPTVSYTYASVSLSATSVKPGANVTIYVKGYPANMDIDFRVGKYLAAPSVIYDAVTDEDGNASAVLTIPSSARAGESWVIFVPTTGMAGGPNLYAPTIRIAE